MLLSNVYETFNGVFDANGKPDNTSALYAENLLSSKRLTVTEEAILLIRKH